MSSAYQLLKLLKYIGVIHIPNLTFTLLSLCIQHNCAISSLCDEQIQHGTDWKLDCHWTIGSLSLRRQSFWLFQPSHFVHSLDLQYLHLYLEPTLNSNQSSSVCVHRRFSWYDFSSESAHTDAGKILVSRRVLDFLAIVSTWGFSSDRLQMHFNFYPLRHHWAHHRSVFCPGRTELQTIGRNFYCRLEYPVLSPGNIINNHTDLE